MQGCFFRPAVGLPPPSWNRRPSADAFDFGCKLFDRHECLLLTVMLLVAPLRGGGAVTLMRIFRAKLNLRINASVVRRKSCPDQPDMPVSPVQAHG